MDIPTRWLNSAMLFLMLLYVYPLKFLFTLLIDELFGFAESEMIEPSQWPLLMVIYGAGFVAIQLVFVLMYLRAYSLRATLELDAHELSVTREEIQGFFLNILVGLVSVAIAVLGGAGRLLGRIRLLAGLPTADDQRPRYGLPQKEGELVPHSGQRRRRGQRRIVAAAGSNVPTARV